MNPAFSVIFLTVLSGAAQGLVVLLSLATLAGPGHGLPFARTWLAVAALLLVGALAASFLHLGRPERAWRAAAMWRTSWLSREVIVLPVFIGAVAVWWWGLGVSLAPVLTRVAAPLVCIALAVALWRCTAMIYACLRFIEEWAQPLTFVNFILIGLSSGFVLGAALLAIGDAGVLAAPVGSAAIALTVVAGLARMAALGRNDRLRHRSTLQSATGIRAPDLRQTAMGMTGGSFNTREFFHHASRAAVARVRVIALGLGFAAPALVGVAALTLHVPLLWWLALAMQAAGLVADRWLFFAQAKHPQNLYYQVVS